MSINLSLFKWASKVLFSNEDASAEKHLGSIFYGEEDWSLERTWQMVALKRCISALLNREITRDPITGTIEIGLQDSLPERYRPSVQDRFVLLRQILRLIGDGARLPLPRELLENIPASLNSWGIRLVKQGAGRSYVEVANAPSITQDFSSDEKVPSLLDPRAECRRAFNLVPADGVLLRTTNFKSYRSITQKLAVGHILTAPERSLFLIALPTGSGKSLFCQLPALQWTRIGTDAVGKMTIMVCPTVALVEDQYQSACAAFGVRSDQVIKVIGDIRQVDRPRLLKRIETGTVAVVIMTPEAVIGYARESIIKAAHAGFLRMLVIDEAHLIDSWGVKFRPAIQRLADFRRELVNLHSNLITILLSATIKPSTEASIKNLYSSSDDNFHLYNGSEIRSEHDFVRNISLNDEHRRDLA